MVVEPEAGQLFSHEGAVLRITSYVFHTRPARGAVSITGREGGILPVAS